MLDGNCTDWITRTVVLLFYNKGVGNFVVQALFAVVKNYHQVSYTKYET